MSSFFSDAWASFKSINGPVLTPVSVALALAAFFFVPSATIELKWIIAIATMLFIFFCVILDMLAKSRSSTNINLPKVINSIYIGNEQEDFDSNNPSIVLLVDSSKLFGFDALVSVYFNQRFGGPKGEVFERLIGLGRISNIQEDGRIQLFVLRALPEHVDLWKRVRMQEAEALSQIVVKPSMPYEASRGVSFNG